jgi:outer membrane immunogenic protein
MRDHACLRPYTNSQRAEYMNTRLPRICLAVAALLLGSAVAQAADLQQPNYKAPAYVGPSYANWTGFYLGLNGGYAWGDSEWSGSAGSFKVSPKGWLFGGTAGYNLQTGTWVWGIEGDFDGADFNGTGSSVLCGSCAIKDTWLATARGRIGYAGWNNWLPYITGGGAGGQAKVGMPTGDENKTQWGWTAGAGVEWAFLANWSAKIEYLYVDLGKFDAIGLASDETVNFKANIVRLGVNYRF